MLLGIQMVRNVLPDTVHFYSEVSPSMELASRLVCIKVQPCNIFWNKIYLAGFLSAHCICVFGSKDLGYNPHLH